MATLATAPVVTIKGNKVTIVLDFDKAGVPSKSGKSLVHATTRGNVAIDGGLSLGVNLFSKA